MATDTSPSFLDQLGGMAIDVGRSKWIDTSSPEDDNNINDSIDVRTGNVPAPPNKIGGLPVMAWAGIGGVALLSVLFFAMRK